MNRIEKIKRLENIKQRYIIIRNYIENNREILDNKEKQKEHGYVKSLVLTKPFYGKQLRVG